MNHLRSVLSYVYSFGCCSYCRENDSIYQGNEPHERTHLLVDPVSNNSPANLLRRTNSDDFINEYPNSLPKRDEQNALSRIVQETATNIIDVASMDAHTHLEQQEYNDRVKTYSHRLAQQWNNIYPTNTETVGLMMDIPNPEAILSSTPVSATDLNMIKNAVHRASMALNDIKVEHTEDLVVPFRIPFTM